MKADEAIASATALAMGNLYEPDMLYSPWISSTFFSCSTTVAVANPV
jgi:hypothetical protein